jgi:dTDP-4-dehydrorhamnose reductase
VKVAVIGANGQLGTDLCPALHGFDVVPLTEADIDISDMASVREAIIGHRPDVIINTAAYVRVDDCEDERDTAYRVNAWGARNVAVVAQELGAKLVHISTDYVLGGEGEPPVVSNKAGGDKPRPYTEFDTPVPLSMYGRSKLTGESLVRHFCLRHFVVRSSALFGVAGAMGKGGNFVETMIRLARERVELRVVNDQVFSPTYTRDLADKIVELMGTEHYGIFHITNRGACSWYEFAVEILSLADITTPVVPISSDMYPQKAARPRYSVLDNYHLRLLGMDDMRPWQEALRGYMGERGSGQGSGVRV